MPHFEIYVVSFRAIVDYQNSNQIRLNRLFSPVTQFFLNSLSQTITVHAIFLGGGVGKLRWFYIFIYRLFLHRKRKI